MVIKFINMTIRKAINILRLHNLWRRDTEGIGYEMADPKELGIAIDTVVRSKLYKRKKRLG